MFKEFSKARFLKWAIQERMYAQQQSFQESESFQTVLHVLFINCGNCKNMVFGSSTEAEST